MKIRTKLGMAKVMLAKKVMMGFEADKRIRKKYGNVPTTATITALNLYNNKTYYFRSKAEVKLARYLQLLKDAKQIKDYAYEQTTFHFPDDRYLVDFDVLNNDGSFEYFEMKGMFDARSRRKLRLINKYRPEVKLTMVFSSRRSAAKLGLAKKYVDRVCILTKNGIETIFSKNTDKRLKELIKKGKIVETKLVDITSSEPELTIEKLKEIKKEVDFAEKKRMDKEKLKRV